jgi:hypothetical protein
VIENVAAETVSAWDAELQELEGKLKGLIGRMGTADMRETQELRSLLSGAKLKLGQARGQLTPSVSAESRARAESSIKDSPHASPTGTKVYRRGKNRLENE